MTAHLPKDDQPGDYTGCWNRVHIHSVYPDTDAGVWHLALPESLRGSYCGIFNPVWLCELPGARLSYRTAGACYVGPKGVGVGQLVKNIFNPWKFKGTPLGICPSCLTLARAEAELLSQPKYAARRLLKQFEGTNTPPVNS